MRKLKYMIARILGMDYKAMFATVRQIHKKTGRNSLWLFVDMVRCGLRYGAGYNDYRICEFYNLTPAQRETYVTRGVNNRIVQLLNDRSYTHIMNDKCEFNQHFSECIHRGWMPMQTATFEEFAAFMENRDRIVTKPLDDACGRGVEILNKADFADLQTMWKDLKDRNSGLIEDVIVQHPDISRLYPHAVNTYRIVTVCVDGQANVVYAFIRMGNGGRAVDNINAGGMAAPIVLETGVIQYPAFDKDSNYYDVHPSTGCPIVGHQLPYWQQAMEMCLQAATKIPQIGYVGWDIAVSQEGPQLIEGNPFPGHDILQMPPHVPDKIGMLPRFKQFVKGL